MKTIISDLNDWQLLQQAGEQGDADAQLEIALHYDNGLTVNGIELVTLDEQMAYEWTKRAYESGNEEAVELYARYLSNGDYCSKNTALAMKLFEEAMNAGSTSAAHSLGIEYCDLHDYEKAFSLYKKADSDDLTIGMCYYYGIGVPKNKLKAFRFFKNALKPAKWMCGYDTNEAHYMLGMMYLEGEVVKQSLSKARHYLSLADEDLDHRSAIQILWIIGQK